MQYKKLLFGLPLMASIVLLLQSLTPADEPKIWASASEPLQEIKALRKNIKAPLFKNKDYNVVDFGAEGNGTTKNTTAFKKAIEACNAAGGGQVFVPAGRFFTGPIYLKSNVNLYLSEGATIVFSKDTQDYPLALVRWEGMDCMNYTSQIYAYHERNVAITGTGTIDGNASNADWWIWKGSTDHGWKAGLPNQKRGRDSLHTLMHNKVDARRRIFGDGYYLRPYMIQTYECQNILISGVNLVNSPMWFIGPVMCDNITVEKVSISSHGPNTDGCDPDACHNVLIKDCSFNTGDDCIAIKSGRDEDGRAFGRPAENHLIEGCRMQDGHGGVVIGSEIAGGARNIYAINCEMSSPDMDIILRIKTSSSRGGIIQNVFMDNIKVGVYKTAAVHCNMFYEKPGNFIPTIRNIWVQNLDVANGGTYGVFVNAYKESPVQTLRLVNCDIRNVKTPVKVDYVKNMEFKNVTINEKKVSSN